MRAIRSQHNNFLSFAPEPMYVIFQENKLDTLREKMNILHQLTISFVSARFHLTIREIPLNKQESVMIVGVPRFSENDYASLHFS